MKPKAIIFGAGERGHFFYHELSRDFDVAAFADNNPCLWGTQVLGTPVIPPEEIKNFENTDVFICVGNGYMDIAKQLEGMGIYGIYLDWYGMGYRCHETVLYPVSFDFRKPYKKEDNKFSVLFVQKDPCGRTDRISSVLKDRGVTTWNAYTRCSSKMPEAYCRENAFYSYDDLLKFVNESEFDIVHCSNEPDVLANLLLHCNKKVIYDAHDFMTIRDYTVSYEVYYLEYAANKFSDGCIATDKYSEKIMRERYTISPDRIMTVHNRPLERQIPACITKKEKLSKRDGQLHIVYEGGISGDRNSNRFMEDMWRIITESNIHIHYYSQQNIAYCKKLEQTSPYLHYEGNLSSLELITEMTQYDIGSILLNPIDKNADISYPNKLYEYLAAGLPVVSNLTVSLEFAEEFRVGGPLDFRGDIQKQLRKIAAIQVPNRFLQDNNLTMDSCADDILAFYRKIVKLGKVRKS